MCENENNEDTCVHRTVIILKKKSLSQRNLHVTKSCLKREKCYDPSDKNSVHLQFLQFTVFTIAVSHLVVIYTVILIIKLD